MPRVSFFILALTLMMALAAPWAPAASLANRLTYLDESDPFAVGLHFPKLTTPQWIGEPGVDAVVTLGIDDLRQPAKYEEFLRPVLSRLQAIDGRAPVSVFCNALDPADPQLQIWLREGLSLEVHTLHHPCPILAKGSLLSAIDTYHGGVELLHQVPGSQPVAFRTPCCDSMNSPSPRLYAEIFARTNAAGQFLQLDSSVVVVLTTNDPALPPQRLVDPSGKPTFGKYLPFPNFVTTVENYPYPWIIGRWCWELPCMAPSDWEAQNILGNTHPTMLADWKTALDLVVLKQGVFNFVFHPHGWSSNQQFVEYIDYAVATHGRRVKFLNYREVAKRLTENLLSGQPLRDPAGRDNGVRLLDLNQDGYLDVVIGNSNLRKTRVWDPAQAAWQETELPIALVEDIPGQAGRDAGVRFGVLDKDGRPTLLVHTPSLKGAWTFQEGRWVEEEMLLRGLDIEGTPVFTAEAGLDRGVRIRDVDGDGVGELLVSNPTQNRVFRLAPDRGGWTPDPQGLPSEVALVNADGQDNGLRFADINEDGFDDLLFSNADQYGLWLYQKEEYLGWTPGWTRRMFAGRREIPWRDGMPSPATPPAAIPPIVRGGAYPNNGAWIHSRHLWFQNEDTAHLPDLVDRRSFDQLLTGTPPPPLSPAEALASFKVRDGFQIELVAAEPLVADPVAFEWDETGRLWVAEMRDYPLGIDGKGQPGGVIKVLTDDDGNGTLDRATEFLRDVPFPNGVHPWRGGVLVSSAPEIFHAVDTDGDGVADRRTTLFRGFKEGNQQHRVNGFNLGLDGWFYGANGDSGGDIQSLATGKSVSISGRDFRFRPDTGEFEAIEGQTQFGRVRDDWGHWFGNANYTWLWWYPWPMRYLQRNPHFAIRDYRQMLAAEPGRDAVYAISRALPRPNVVGAEGTVTSACSPCPYRDDLFGPEFASSVFIAEPTENLVHREVLERSGSGFTARRADGEETTEFLASTDNWFRPVYLRTGPDGALYVADMYRLVIEHPEWIPEDLKRRWDLRAGTDRGRIYRIAPTRGMVRRDLPFQSTDAATLAQAMDDPNGWRRDTAMRLLLERPDPAAIPALRNVLRTSSRPKARLQALGTLGALGRIETADLLRSLNDPHPSIRASGLQWAESHLSSPQPPSELKSRALSLVSDPAPEVRLQAAFSLGQWSDPHAVRALLSLAESSPSDDLLLVAIASGAHGKLDHWMAALDDCPKLPWPLLRRLIGQVAAAGTEPTVSKAAQLLLKPASAGSETSRFIASAEFLESLSRRRPSRSNEIFTTLAPLLRESAEAARNETADPRIRTAAMKVLERAGNASVPWNDALLEMLTPKTPHDLQEAAVRALCRQSVPETSRRLLSLWPQLTPRLRSVAVDVTLERPAGSETLVQALESGMIGPRDLGPIAQQKLRDQSDARWRERAIAVLGVPRTARAEVVDSYRPAVNRPGDAARGRTVFLDHCAPCHRFRGEGQDLGPDLGAVVDKTREALLIAILDPNRAFEDRYAAYLATTAEGHQILGLVAAESASHVTLRGAAGLEETLPRRDLKSLVHTGRSLMPEGFEVPIETGAMADLLTYIAPPQRSTVATKNPAHR